MALTVFNVPDSLDGGEIIAVWESANRSQTCSRTLTLSLIPTPIPSTGPITLCNTNIKPFSQPHPKANARPNPHPNPNLNPNPHLNPNFHPDPNPNPNPNSDSGSYPRADSNPNPSPDSNTNSNPNLNPNVQTGICCCQRPKSRLLMLNL